jgi:hypothetical protein
MHRLRVLLLSLLAVLAVSAIASASASAAFKLEWEAAKCEAQAGGKYEESECNKEGATKAFELVFKALTGAETRTIESESLSAFKLEAGTKVITCQKNTGEGTAASAGKGEATTITFTECATSEAGCNVKSAGQANGTIVVKAVPTKLVEREPGGGGVKKLANEFKENATTKEFVTLKFEPDAGKTCTNFPETKVQGQVAAIVENQTSGEENGDVNLTFPEPAELKGNTLKAFGIAAKLFGKVKTGCISITPPECEAIRGV